MTVLLLLGFAWLVHRFERPLHFAVGYSVLALLLGLMFESIGWALALGFLGTLAFSAAYFSLLNRVSDTIATWLAVLVGGALLWFFLPLLAA
ncbi:hypothetical protein OOT46_22920 [Aquabacterium sp. A7-Y]|uniref:hypothetical protein n=1 Tax=Aquabacterium sp. A7-Y TaxID=1349605 RepID=UPI00223E7893|nr:hypothetical protein [Aquabacterium sp. A7-Y]MCW7540676.1 hypothetical protein [Aquabacterium sp. A7-Y]